MLSRRTYGIVLVAPLILSCLEGCKQETASLEADVEAINQLRQQEVAAAEAGDVNALMSLRVEDFVAMPPDHQAVTGEAEVRVWLTTVLEQVDLEETVSSHEVVVAGDWAYDRGVFTGKATPKAGAEAIQLDGKYLWILRRQPDGSWKYAIHMWSSNQL